MEQGKVPAVNMENVMTILNLSCARQLGFITPDEEIRILESRREKWETSMPETAIYKSDDQLGGGRPASVLREPRLLRMGTSFLSLRLAALRRSGVLCRRGWFFLLFSAGVLLMSTLMAAYAAQPETTPLPAAETATEYMIGVNWAGAEFAPRRLPGVEGQNFGWPTAASLDYWKSKGIRLIRLPFSWERLQPMLMKDFDPTYREGLERSVKLIGERNMRVILDLHNYASYRGKPLGSDEVPMEAFGDVWRRLAEMSQGKPAVYGYGLMNEPGKCDWAKAAQTAIDAIRKIDLQTRIYVANDYPGWSAQYAKADLAAWAESEMRIGDPKILKDPANLLRWELHTYMDHDASGTYRKPYEFEISRKDGPVVRVGPEIGVNRVKPFVAWLKKHNVKGLIGEYSVPANPGVDERWLVCLDNMLAYLKAEGIPSTFWAGGTHWTPGRDYVIEPAGWSKDLPDEKRQEDRPQLKIMLKYLPSGNN